MGAADAARQPVAGRCQLAGKVSSYRGGKPPRMHLVRWATSRERGCWSKPSSETAGGQAQTHANSSRRGADAVLASNTSISNHRRSPATKTPGHRGTPNPPIHSRSWRPLSGLALRPPSRNAFTAKAWGKDPDVIR